MSSGLSVAFALEVDFSRRQVGFTKVENENRIPAGTFEDESTSIVSKVFDGSGFEAIDPAQDIVIMNTDKGFIPEVINLKKGNNYRMHIVNINGKEKNVSFVMDAFSEHHNTFYGEQKAFTVSPKIDGIFSFQCPETAMQGKLVVYSESGGEVGGKLPSSRKPASK
jgi:plastocyanin domain-containing protein